MPQGSHPSVKSTSVSVVKSTSIPEPKLSTARTQSKLSFKKISREEWQAQDKIRAQRSAEERLDAVSRAEQEKMHQSADRREQGRKGKAAFREGEREQENVDGIRGEDGKLIVTKRVSCL